MSYESVEVLSTAVLNVDTRISKQISYIKQKLVKDPIGREADQLAICKGWRSQSVTTKHKFRNPHHLHNGQQNRIDYIFKVLCTSVSKRVLMENFSCEKRLYFHENQPFHSREHIFLRIVSHEDYFWHWCKGQYANGLFKLYALHTSFHGMSAIIPPLKIWFRFYFTSFF